MATLEAEEAERSVSTEAERVVGWRRQELLRAGYREPWASMFALRQDVDLHLAVDLLRRGCPVETALRILL